jgi:hypothetical protein
MSSPAKSYSRDHWPRELFLRNIGKNLTADYTDGRESKILLADHKLSQEGFTPWSAKGCNSACQLAKAFGVLTRRDKL